MFSQEILNNKTYQNLQKHGVYSYKAINSISSLTISEYLAKISSGKIQANNVYSDIAVDVLKTYLSRYFDKLRVEEAVAEFLKFPAIQVADHIGLFCDFNNFINNFLWNISLEKNNINYLFTCQCETVRAVQDAHNLLGPAFADVNGNIYNIFGFSKNKLKNSNMACLNNCSFIFESLCQNNNLDLPDILKAIINDSKQPDYAPDMFHRANLLFWDKIKYNKKRELICLDHRFFCDIIAENILKNTPIINAILFDKIKRRSFLSVKEKIIQSEKNLVLRNTTDFFYLKKGDELIPLKIGGGGYFYSGRSGKVAFTSNKKLSLDREIIYEALKSRDLYPDLILSNIFGHILPKIIAIGGTSQLEYLPNIVRILKEFLAINDISDDFGCENKKIDETDYGRLIGPGLIKFTESDREFISRLNSQSDLDEFVNSFCDKKIGDVLNIDFWSYFNIFYQRKRNRKD